VAGEREGGREREGSVAGEREGGIGREKEGKGEGVWQERGREGRDEGVR